MEKIVNTYEASAADGSTVTVYEVQEMDNAGTIANPNQKVAASSGCSFRTDGR